MFDEEEIAKRKQRDSERSKPKVDPLGASPANARRLFELQQPIMNRFRHVGRNDPCPCGSGKKFKKCCLGQEKPA